MVTHWVTDALDRIVLIIGSITTVSMRGKIEREKKRCDRAGDHDLIFSGGAIGKESATPTISSIEP